MNKGIQIAGLAVVGLGTLLIALGAYISVKDWAKKQEGISGAKAQALGGTFKGLAKVIEALKDYPLGQQLIGWGILVTIIGGVLGGVGGLIC